ncbi:hypothetical protein AX17_006051 [Amanita inopinata Kibby_2008]|nr:hypothetical protein AX17_006051 [Amanita inopinata Kibby_2008]
MHLDQGYQDLKLNDGGCSNYSATSTERTDLIKPPLEWDWEYEHADRKYEAKADVALHGAIPFQVDRKVLKDVVREKMGVDVGRITFLSSGTFHKAYLITLGNRVELVARVARRFMPRLKTESEVATMNYLRERTDVPVPTVYHYDSNPYNRLGGEYILMSKAPGIPLAQVFHSLGYNELTELCQNLASIVIPLFSHRFSEIGSLYSGPDPRTAMSSSAATPKASEYRSFEWSLSSTLSVPTLTNSVSSLLREKPQKPRKPECYVGPIVSWPFFGSNRGELLHPTEINRGPWSSTTDYLASCAEREIAGVIRENEGKSAPHKLHLDPDEIRSSRHHHLNAVPGDESDESDEWDLEESEGEWDGPGDVMYRDYRRMQRTTFLVAHLTQRQAIVQREMARWTSLMAALSKMIKADVPEEFSLDCHDLSLENVFVDADDPTKITCIIDWESTSTRPLWACAHLPAFLQSSPFTARLFRQTVENFISDPSSRPTSEHCKDVDIASLAKEWLYYEQVGVRLRLAHRFVEWDGWEEGLIDSILGSEELEDEWFRDWDNRGSAAIAGSISPPCLVNTFGSPSRGGGGGRMSGMNDILVSVAPVARRAPVQPVATGMLPFVQEKDKEKMLNTTGDICGGRGGELGRRLEAWLTVSGDGGKTGRERWSADAGTEVE